MVHTYHGPIKFPRLKNTFKLGNLTRKHKIATDYANILLNNLYKDFDTGVRQVKNSYLGNSTGKIFGIGLGRTGTLSLATALRILGYKTAHYPEPPLLPDIYDTIEQYDAACDSPIAHAYQSLDTIYPGSKFILTTRGLQSWMSSCRRFKHFRVQLDGQKKKLREELYRCPTFNGQAFRRTHTRFHTEVANFFKGREKDLLIMDITQGDGWEKLCKFLDKPIPDKPFPHKHKSR
jgi:hypothetical protein